MVKWKRGKIVKWLKRGEKSEVGRWKLEDGSWKRKDGGQESEFKVSSLKFKESCRPDSKRQWTINLFNNLVYFFD
jgi:hypothetical protein